MGVGTASPLKRKPVMDIFWLFFMLSALQPVIKQRLLEASRKRLIALIERQRKSRVVLLVHRQETMSLLGFPVFRYIDINDSEEVLRAIHLTDPEIPLDLGPAHPRRIGPGCNPDRACCLQAQGQGHGVCSALCHVRWNIDCAGGGRYRYVRACGLGPGRSAVG